MGTDLKPATFRMEQELLDRLQSHKVASGVPVSEQVRRAIRQWLDEQEPLMKAERKRVSARKRS
jgi:predicted DNA-binding protein